MSEDKIVTALVQGEDKPGIIATITGFIYENNGNIIYLDQHTDQREKMFFMRVQFSLEGFKIPRREIDYEFGKVCESLGQSHSVYFSDQKKRVAIMVSRQGHCLSDLLYRWQIKDIEMEVAAIISNHEDQERIARYYEIPYCCFPVDKNNKIEQEKRILQTLREKNVDTVVLARYMQILTPQFVNAYPDSIINIHHSFLPAFVGANPYLQAFKRGVKIIGATSHYVTEELDRGPIIAQDVIKVSHRDTVENLKRKGRDIERLVLARAVNLHVENRILVHKGKTIVFGD